MTESTQARLGRLHDTAKARAEGFGGGEAALRAEKARHEELVARRRSLEQRAEGEVSALAATLDELAALDPEQREAEVSAGIMDPPPKGFDQRPELHVVLRDWIGDRLDRFGAHPLAGPTPAKGADHEEALAERDPLTPAVAS